MDGSSHVLRLWIRQDQGSQFTVLDSELTRSLGEVSGFRLTWHYFGYSPAYGTVLALIQILSCVLLMVVRRAESGPDEMHHFEIDDGEAVRVWEKWLSKGPLIMEGRRTSER
jgi:hypothetical protein